jgi:hypothetical protein
MVRDDAADSSRGEWYAIAVVGGAVAYLRAGGGRGTIGVVAATGLLALVIALARCALFRRIVTHDAGRYEATIAGVVRLLTVPVMLAFPATVVATSVGPWRGALAGHAWKVDLWIGTTAYLLAILELTQLRVWSLNITTREADGTTRDESA